MQLPPVGKVLRGLRRHKISGRSQDESVGGQNKHGKQVKTRTDEPEEATSLTIPAPRSRRGAGAAAGKGPSAGARGAGTRAASHAATTFQVVKKPRRMGHTTVYIHEDEDTRSRSQPKRRIMQNEHQHQPAQHFAEDDEETESVAETRSEVTDDEDVDESVAEDMRKLEESFKGISEKYRLINRIGEGTFSTVYKAEQLLDETEEDPKDEHTLGETDANIEVPATKRRKTSFTSSQTTVLRPRRKTQLVALKKIYVTSSPSRIANELELLYMLRGSPYICPLLTAFRHLDQVVIVLPYFRHLDFRLYYRDFLVSDMRLYFKALFSALHSVHKSGILHRDIKPTNFLYDHARKTGVLVDFGLAEKEGTEWQHCLCQEKKEKRRDRFLNSFAVQQVQGQPNQASAGYPKNDPRPSRRANRAGTRGFRAPEVLFKCTAQTTKIDIWSAGVILLTLLARRFPFFNSTDDVDAMIELSSIFGRKRMMGVAAIHGSIYETNIETIGENGFSLEKIIIWASCRNKDEEVMRAGESQAVSLLTGLLELDPTKRFTAKEALSHEFFTAPLEDEVERAERIAQEDGEMEGVEEG